MRKNNGGRAMRRQRGQALMAVTGAFALVLLLLTAALTITQYSGRIVGRQLTYQGQALNAAQAGLTDSLSWFRRQGVVVKTFTPKLDVANKINDTEDAAVGIVRTFEMSDTFNLKGRYTVPKTVVKDISVQKGKSGAGTVWLLESTGCVFTGNYELANGCDTKSSTLGKIVTRETVRAEIQRLNLVLPAGGSAIYARRASGVTIGPGSKVQGGSGIGLAYPTGTGTATTTGAIVTGTNTPTSDATVPAKITIPDIFGVTVQEVLAMSDVNVTKVSELPNPLPQMNLIVIRGNAVFDSSFPLNGSGIMIVFGDLTIPANTNASWSGVLYVTGNFSIAQPSLISGAVVAAGNGNTSTSGTGGAVTVSSSGDISEIDFDQSIITQIQTQMGAYRFSRSMYIVGKEAK